MQINRSLAPGKRLVITFQGNEGDPPEKQPRIFAKTLTANDDKAVLSILSRLNDSGNGNHSKMIEMAIEGVALCLTGWENVTDEDGKPVAFSKEAIGSVLRTQDCMEIMNFVMEQGRLTVEDRKKSD